MTHPSPLGRDDPPGRAAPPSPSLAVNGIAAGLVSELRSPLSRIELAVSQLERELATPAGRELAASISQAVREADREIERILPLLAPRARSAQSAELGGVVTRLCERLAPVLEARGTTLAQVGDADLFGDPRLVEQAALALVRVGSRLIASDGRLELGLRAFEGRLGVVLRGRCALGEPDPEDPCDADPGDPGERDAPSVEPRFAALRPWAARHGGSISSEGTRASWRVSLWLPTEAA